MSAPRLPPALIAISPGDLAGDGLSAANGRAAFLRNLERACDAGLRGLVLREGALTDRDFLVLAQHARKLLAQDRWLAIHDRGHLVAAAGADALHLGFRSLVPAVARTILDPSIAIGYSAHSGDDPVHWRSSDYIFFGPVLATPSKEGLKSSVGFDGLAEAVRTSTTPTWGIGGLKPEHVAHVRATGARGIAVLSGIFAAPDPAAATREYARAVEG